MDKENKETQKIKLTGNPTKDKERPSLKDRRKKRKEFLKMLKRMPNIYENKMVSGQVMTGEEYREHLEQLQKKTGKDYSETIRNIRTEKEDGVKAEYEVPVYDLQVTAPADMIDEVMKEYAEYGEAGVKYFLAKLKYRIQYAAVLTPQYYHEFDQERLEQAYSEFASIEEIEELKDIYEKSLSFYKEALKAVEANGKKKMEIEKLETEREETEAEERAKKEAEAQRVEKEEKSRETKEKAGLALALSLCLMLFMFLLSKFLSNLG